MGTHSGAYEINKYAIISDLIIPHTQTSNYFI